MLIVMETMLFSGLISSFFYIRGGHRVWPPFGASDLQKTAPAIATTVIVASSVALILAQVSVRRDDRTGVRIGLGLALFMGLLFMGAMIHEWMGTEVTVRQGVFGASYYLLTGCHVIHVVLGLGFLANALAGSLRNRYSPSSHFGITAAGMYWHFVTLVWLVIYPVVYLY